MTTLAELNGDSSRQNLNFANLNKYFQLYILVTGQFLLCSVTKRCLNNNKNNNKV